MTRCEKLFTCFVFNAFDFVRRFGFRAKSETVKTKAGNLILTKSEDSLFQIKIGDEVLFESQTEFGTVAGKYTLNNPKFILLSIGENALACATHFYIVDVSKKEPAITEAFGNCSPAPKILFQNQTLIVKFPDGRKNKSDYKYGAAETWQYRNGKLKKLR
ncbi:MAG TPA: hypothetical protein VNI60_03310 [Pyrinomonadaceae bacterium]|nr:hypothetical protein [Pyrinomonadaceae bacterium]